jgi:hypothetical protein
LLVEDVEIAIAAGAVLSCEGGGGCGVHIRSVSCVIKLEW